MDHFSIDKYSETPHLYEDDIKRLFMLALEELLKDRDALIADCEYMLKVFSDTSGIENSMKMLTDEINNVAVLTEKLISDNASKPMDQTEYNRKYDDFSIRYNKARAKYDELEALALDRKAKAKNIRQFIDCISSAGTLPMDFSEFLWNGIIDHVTVNADESLDFVFINGQTIKEEL